MKKKRVAPSVKILILLPANILSFYSLCYFTMWNDFDGFK